MEDLLLEVGQAHFVVVDQPQRPDTCRRQIGRRRRAERPQPDDQHARLQEAVLAAKPDLGQGDVPRVALHLRWSQRMMGHAQPRAARRGRPGTGLKIP